MIRSMTSFFGGRLLHPQNGVYVSAIGGGIGEAAVSYDAREAVCGHANPGAHSYFIAISIMFRDEILVMMMCDKILTPQGR